MALPSPAGVFMQFWRIARDVVRGSGRHLFTKAANFLLIWLQRRILRPARVIGYPYYLTVDPVDVCNLRCPLCPTGRRADGRSRGMMRLEDFRKLVDEVSPYLFVLDLFNWGEPLLNRDVFAMVAYARRRGIIVRLSSNLNHFDGGMADALAASGCDFLLLSLYGASQESCSRYQAGTDFARVMVNVRLIRGRRRRLPVVVWRFLVHRHNEREIEKAQAAAHAVDILEVSSLHCDIAQEIYLDNRAQYENIKEWLPEDGQWSIYDYRRKGKKRQRVNTCSALYNNPAVNWNGSVSPCCLVWYERDDFGNAFQEGFSRVWNNERFRASRRLIFHGREDGAATICTVCRKNKAML